MGACDRGLGLFKSMALGISIAPQVWPSIMEVCNSIWRKKRRVVFTYFDNILRSEMMLVRV